MFFPLPYEWIETTRGKSGECCSLHAVQIGKQKTAPFVLGFCSDEDKKSRLCSLERNSDAFQFLRLRFASRGRGKKREKRNNKKLSVHFHCVCFSCKKNDLESFFSAPKRFYRTIELLKFRREKKQKSFFSFPVSKNKLLSLSGKKMSKHHSANSFSQAEGINDSEVEISHSTLTVMRKSKLLNKTDDEDDSKEMFEQASQQVYSQSRQNHYALI